MARAGEEIVNPKTGERIVWRRVAADTAGEVLEFDFLLAPGGAVPMPHRHPNQVERFEIISGSARFRLGGKKFRAAAGQTVEVPKGMVHRVQNPGPEAAHMVVRFVPALRIESVLEDLWALARAGRTNRIGIPRNPLQAAVFAETYFQEGALSWFPIGLQRFGVGLVAPLGRRLGHRFPLTGRA